MYQQCFLQVAVAIAVVKGLTEPDLIDKAYGALRLDLPMAPGLGLVLQEVNDWKIFCSHNFTFSFFTQVHYDRYNRKFGKDGLHETLTWEAEEEAVQKFKKDFVMPTIIEGEKEGKS
jgi:tRNA pseudouridine38-40 synthase